MDISKSLKSWVRERKSETLRIFSLPIDNSNKKIEVKQDIPNKTIRLSLYENQKEVATVPLDDATTVNQLILVLETLKKSTWNT